VISKRIKGRKDGKSSAGDALRYGEGLEAARNRETGEILDKSHRTRFGNFGLVDDGVYAGRDVSAMAELIELAAVEMQSNCDLNTRVGADKKLAHFVVSYNQDKPTEAILRDTEDSMLAAMDLDKNHFATFLHNDNGYWHLHIFASRIEKDYPHRGNPLWQDKKKRDKVCREIEIRHRLSRDNGLHEIDAQGQIIEVPLAERKAKREGRPKTSDRAQTVERYSGEKSFQTWCNEIRIGDRLKHAKSWQDLHAAATAYNCEIKPKGAGFVVCPIGEKGGISLSTVGLKNLPAKFGAFQPMPLGPAVEAVATYTPEPTMPAGSLHQEWKEARAEFRSVKTTALNELRTTHATARAELRKRQCEELAAIRSAATGQDRAIAVSIAKLTYAVALTELAAEHASERQQVRGQLAEGGPGATFRDYLVKQAIGGNDVALALARKYGADEATDVSRKREAEQFKVVAAARGLHDRSAPRLNFSHRIERSGTVIFDLGRGRQVIDSAISKQIQLNNAAAHDPAAVETSLRFATAKFGNKLVLTGPAEFQKLAVEIAVKKGLGITFADPALDAYREKLEAERKTPKFIQPGKAQTTEWKYEHNESHYRRQPPRQIPPAHRRDRLHYLSDGDVVLNTKRDVLPLRQDVPGRVEQSRQEKPDHRMQRAVASAGRGRSSGLIPSPSEPVKPMVRPPQNAEALQDLTQRLAREVKEEAYAAIVASVKQRGGTIFEIKNGVPYVGTVQLLPDGRFAIQDQGRGAVAIHDLSKLEGQYESGQECEIQYRDGRGIATRQRSQHERTPTHRGR
jgi:hypothetical protein